MRIPFVRNARDYAIEPLRVEDSAALARIHREDFAPPWEEGDFQAMLGEDIMFGYKAVEIGKTRSGAAGFVLARDISGEAEIITIAVARAHRRRGLGRLLMDAVLRELHGARAAVLFLEVDEGNAAAVALYRQLGFREVGKRTAYYRSAAGVPSNALVMRRDLR
ncbi:MAG: ribosomal protein S18-alanine N-acetyltransferase [Hyphomicrobiales bacterium]|nr:ribosomal protein S18-alanine N-acetyltransferase [Hyphomicrobiales bacterium]